MQKRLAVEETFDPRDQSGLGWALSIVREGSI